MSKLTHFNDRGGAHMVDVGSKADTSRVAIATGRIRMQAATAEIIRAGTASKGNVLAVAQVAGIMAAKNTPQIVPMCHPLMLTGVDISFDVQEDAVEITATVKTTGKTGVEMEALTAVSAAALTVYDMVKAVDRGMIIENIKVEAKSGGASGEWNRDPASAALCDDGLCNIDSGTDPVEVDLGTISGIRMAVNPTQSGDEGSKS